MKQMSAGWASAAHSLPATLIFLGAAFAIILSLPDGYFGRYHNGLLAIGMIGLARNLWLLTNQLRGAYYQRVHFPVLRAQERGLSAPYPERLFVIVPSYREDPLVTERSVRALARELSLLPSRVYVLFSVSGPEEMAHIHSLMRTHGRREKMKFTFMEQRDGKRMALGQALRAVSREFHRVVDWHADANNDIVVLMDGDTEIQHGCFRRSLGFFRLDPLLGALTTDEKAEMVTPEAAASTISPWFDLKFAKRHTMMSSHALAGRVLTLTGRFSIFRAAPILSPAFIGRIENDSLQHWVFGHIRFLMGDDKSTWFDLLKNGWRMLYLPDVCVNCLETRGGHFISTSGSLMFRWFGNMARNNWRALSLGPLRMPFFIWLSILDQRISMWTSLIGPLAAAFGTYHYGFGVLAVYVAWVLMTRTLYLWLLVPRGFVIRPVHIALQVYDQWFGSLAKIGASLLLNRQSWAKGKSSKQSGKAERWHWREMLAWFRLSTTVIVFLLIVLILADIVRLPRQWHLIPSALGAEASATVYAVEHGIIPDDGHDDAQALQALIEQTAIEHIILPAGQIDLEHALYIRRSHLEIRGAGPDKTRLVATNKILDDAQSPAAIVTIGHRGRGRPLGAIDAAWPAGVTEPPSPLNAARQPARWLMIEADNSPEFLDHIGSQRWRKTRPPLRSWMSRYGADGRLSDPPLITFPAGSRLFELDLVHHVALRGLAIELRLDKQPPPSPTNYENSHPNFMLDNLALNWVADSSLTHLDLRNAGRHPLRLEQVSQIEVRHLRIDGAWNKGPGGSGYLRLARAFNCQLHDIEVRNIRHLTFQWGASGNHLSKANLGVDINFHGGYAHHNLVENSRFDIPATHPWPPVSRTPDDAHWAPPDGPENRVLNSSATTTPQRND